LIIKNHIVIISGCNNYFVDSFARNAVSNSNFIKDQTDIIIVLIIDKATTFNYITILLSLIKLL